MVYLLVPPYPGCPGKKAIKWIVVVTFNKFIFNIIHIILCFILYLLLHEYELSLIFGHLLSEAFKPAFITSMAA